MPSDAKKKKAQQKKANQQKKVGGKAPGKENVEDESFSNGNSLANESTNRLQELAIEEDSDRAVTGVLTSHPLSRDIHIESFSLLFHGHELLQDTTLELNYGRRYGLIGPNGCGKSCMLKCIAARELPIPEAIDIYFLDREVVASEKTALEAVLEVDSKRLWLEAEADRLNELDQTDAVVDQLTSIYDRLDALGADTIKTRAASILHGLGFNAAMQAKKTQDFSGGWRMRIALAKALLMEPTVLLLDEPTNHLDLEACVWLEEYLKKFDRILLMVSHSQDFLNGVCTNIINMSKSGLKYYGGNYDTYVQTRKEQDENQMKQYKWEQEQIKNMKEYIARFGHGSAKLARQAQSKEKTLQKMVDAGLTERVEYEKTVQLKFDEAGKLPPPVLQFVEVAFGYSPDKILYRNVDLGVDMDTRVAVVGPNGAGKSTLLKLMTGQLDASEGMVKRHNHLRIGVYHQHLMEKLDGDLTPLEYMMKAYPGFTLEKMRSIVGRFGITGGQQTLQIKNLSDGLKSRVVFAQLAMQKPNLLLLDEPTNHLDMETIDSLANAINNWDGGMVLVSHDFRLIGQVATEIWEVRDGAVHIWPGDIVSYKKHLKKKQEQLAIQESKK